MSGRRSRNKGNRRERELVEVIKDCGYEAERVPLSGAAGGSFGGDVIANFGGDDWKLECKARAEGWKQLYSWLDGVDAVALKADRKEWLVVMPLWQWLELMG